MTLSKYFCYKGDYAKTIITKYDCINLNVIKVIMVIISNYGYSINSIKQCITLSNYHNIYILIFYWNVNIFYYNINNSTWVICKVSHAAFSFIQLLRKFIRKYLWILVINAVSLKEIEQLTSENWTFEVLTISNLYHNDNTVLMINNIKLCLQGGVTLDT